MQIMKTIMLASVATLALVGTAEAQRNRTTAAAPQIIDATMVDEIAKIASGFGEATVSTDSRGDPKIDGEVDGTYYTVYFYGCDTETHDKCNSLSFYAGFSWEEPSAAVANKWNYEKRYGKAFVADDVGPDLGGKADEAYIALQWDVDLLYGTTYDNMDAIIETWTVNLGLFVDFLGENA